LKIIFKHKKKQDNKKETLKKKTKRKKNKKQKQKQKEKENEKNRGNRLTRPAHTARGGVRRGAGADLVGI
jgi:mannitol-specific phosphotransferase system IIBC component